MNYTYFPYHPIDIRETGRTIKQYMDTCNISVKDVASALLISSQAVYKWINGESIPSLENFVQLSHLLNTTIDSLIICGEAVNYEVKPYCVRESIYPVYLYSANSRIPQTLF